MNTLSIYGSPTNTSTTHPDPKYSLSDCSYNVCSYVRLIFVVAGLRLPATAIWWRICCMCVPPHRYFMISTGAVPRFALPSTTHRHQNPHSYTLDCTQTLTHSLSTSLTNSHTHSLIHSPLTARTHTCTHARTHSLTHSFTHSLTHSLTHQLTHSLTQSLPHSLTRPHAW